ncbi:MAG: vWA domain-containing protein [Acidobacteriota bacterium]
MKRTTILLFSLALAWPLLASESFVLNVPLRFNVQQETGEVRVVLGLSGAPAGAQLVVNGMTTLNLGDTVSVGGDSVSFLAGTGNAVRITYQPLSNFGADFCDAAAASEKNVPMRFSGAQDVVSYRLNSYVVGAPSAECSKVSKRTADQPASLIPSDDGVAPELNAMFLGRLPIDVVLVLDKSGSMNDRPPGALSGPTKAAVLQSAVQVFVAQWREVDQPTAEGLEWSEDRIGVVFFDSTAAAQSLVGGDPPANFFVQRGPGGPGPAHKWNEVSTNVATLTPGGSTSVGGGINTAMSHWVADPAHDLVLIVVTDGIQNAAPLFTASPSGFLGLLPVSGLDQELRKRFIPIQTIGFGTPASVDADLLTNLSFQTSGVSFITVNSTTMFDTFGLTLVSILKGNTVSLGLRRQDTMTGAGPSPSRSLIVDASARRAVFSVQWAPPEVDALDLEVFRPDGTAAVPTSAEKTRQAALQTFDMTRGDLGKWTVRVKRGRGKVAQNRPLPYNLNAFILERDLDYRFSLDAVRSRTGEKIQFRANVSYDGKPLAGLPANAIRVRVLRPLEGLGTILHDTRIADSSSGATPTPAGDVVSAYDRKLALLGRRVLERVTPRDVLTVTLKETSRGAYVGSFDETTVAGTYAFEVVLDWDDKRTGHVRREERLEQIVRVLPDPAQSVIATSRSGNTVQISVTPRDRFGNFVGPGYGSLVKARLNAGGKLVERAPVDRNQTGTYVFTVTGVPSGVTPDVDLIVDGVMVGNPSRKR